MVVLACAFAGAAAAGACLAGGRPDAGACGQRGLRGCPANQGRGPPFRWRSPPSWPALSSTATRWPTTPPRSRRRRGCATSSGSPTITRGRARPSTPISTTPASTCCGVRAALASSIRRPRARAGAATRSRHAHRRAGLRARHRPAHLRLRPVLQAHRPRTGPARSRPPSNWDLAERTRHFEIWRKLRPAGSVLLHEPYEGLLGAPRPLRRQGARAPGRGPCGSPTWRAPDSRASASAFSSTALLVAEDEELADPQRARPGDRDRSPARLGRVRDLDRRRLRPRGAGQRRREGRWPRWSTTTATRTSTSSLLQAASRRGRAPGKRQQARRNLTRATRLATRCPSARSSSKAAAAAGTAPCSEHAGLRPRRAGLGGDRGGAVAVPEPTFSQLGPGGHPPQAVGRQRGGQRLPRTRGRLRRHRGRRSASTTWPRRYIGPDARTPFTTLVWVLAAPRRERHDWPAVVRPHQPPGGARTRARPGAAALVVVGGPPTSTWPGRGRTTEQPRAQRLARPTDRALRHLLETMIARGAAARAGRSTGVDLSFSAPRRTRGRRQRAVIFSFRGGLPSHSIPVLVEARPPQAAVPDARLVWWPPARPPRQRTSKPRWSVPTSRVRLRCSATSPTRTCRAASARPTSASSLSGRWASVRLGGACLRLAARALRPPPAPRPSRRGRRRDVRERRPRRDCHDAGAAPARRSAATGHGPGGREWARSPTSTAASTWRGLAGFKRTFQAAWRRAAGGP